MQEAANQSQRALELAYRYINRRERTIAEVAARLSQAEIDPSTARATIDELIELGSLDDVRFARLFTEDKRGLEQWGTERIARGLAARGIDRELITAALAETEPDSELERALGVLARRFPVPPTDHRERERALAMLLRKGYDSETALTALRTARRCEAGTRPFT